jgi:3-methyladenine DNA glycosylase AlkC
MDAQRRLQFTPYFSMNATPRKGASRIADIPPEILAALNEGRLETRTLAESLAIDFVVLLRAVSDVFEPQHLAPLQDEKASGITKRMRLAAAIARQTLGEEEAVTTFADHASDTARGIAAHIVADASELDFAERFVRIRHFADDGHFGVREWAWLALRPHIVAAPTEALQILQPWTREASANLRRFAVEATRPRGVWSSHIQAFKDDPALGLPLLEPLSEDASPYVQDSVANWLNDAAKTRPQWVRSLCDAWAKRTASPNTARIVKRARRSLD